MSNIPNTIDDLNSLSPEVKEAIIKWESTVYNRISGKFLAENHLTMQLDQNTGLMTFIDIQIEKHSFGIDVSSFIPFIQAINVIFSYDQSITAGVIFCYTQVSEWLGTKV